MYKGIAFALGACFIWGLIFIVPQLAAGFSSIEVAFGRYLVYGSLSCLILIRLLAKGKCCHSFDIWVKAFGFSLVSTIGLYTLMVLALRHSSPAICALTLGISPISIAFYGNWKKRETSFRNLIIPSLLIVAGLIAINIPHFDASESTADYLWGLLFGFVALFVWSWFVVANSEFLKSNPGVNSSDWSTLIGVAALFWTCLFAGFLNIFFAEHLHTEKYFVINEEWKRFWVGSAILGLLCSWVAVFLWNKASLYLPITVAGQLTIFETIFGTLFVYIAKQTLPSSLESIGIAILLTGVIYGIKKFEMPSSAEPIPSQV